MVRPVAMSSSQVRRDQPQPTYSSPPTSAPTTTMTTMYAPIAERAIPYEQYMARDGEHIYSASRVTPRSAPAASRGTTDDVTAQEMRQFSREPTVISLSSSVDDDVKTTTPAAGSRSTVGGDKVRSAGSGGEGACITAGFDSNTLKRMLQTLPELSTPVDLTQEFEEEFANVVGPSTVSAAARDDVKPLPPPPLPDNDHPLPISSVVTVASTASNQRADVSPVTSHPDMTTSTAEVALAPVSVVSEEKTAIENGNAELENSEQTAAPVQLTDVALTTVPSTGRDVMLYVLCY